MKQTMNWLVLEICRRIGLTNGGKPPDPPFGKMGRLLGASPQTPLCVKWNASWEQAPRPPFGGKPPDPPLG